MRAVKRWLAFFLFTGCVDVVNHGIDVRVRLTQQRCDDTPLFDAPSFRTIVKTPTQTVLDRIGPPPTSLALAPAEDVVIRVEALDAEGRTIARAQSTHLVITETPRPELKLVLYPLGRFTKICSGLREARSAHSATLLKDGSVLIAGGRGSTGDALSTMEQIGAAFVDAAGTISVLAQGQRFQLPRAHHSALRVASTGQVFISGGESGTTPTALATHLFTDPDVGFAIGALGPGLIPRTRHVTLQLDESLLLFGGLTRDASALVPTDVVERIDLSTLEISKLTPLPEVRDEASIVLLGRDVLVAGGTRAGVSRSTIDVFREGDAAHATRSSMRLPRSGAAITVVGQRALIAGGLDATGAMTGTTEWLTTSNAVAGPAITPRMHACALTLGERVLIVGGEDANGLSAAAELIEADGSVTTVSFAGPPRVEHACVVREDGSALIVGGRGAEGALDDLWQFTLP